jgi:3-oxoacyl-[acyl-carrier protein] reductase
MSHHRRISVLSSHIAPTPVEVSSLSVVPTAASGGILQGQVAIITGSGQGIGEAAAKLFAKEGAKVVVTDLDAVKANAVVSAIKSAGGQAIAVPGDVTDAAYPDKLIKETINAFGKINIIVNNAGYTWDGVVHTMTDQQWDAMLKVHNTAPFRIVRAAAPFFRDVAKKEIQEKGATQEPRVIINVSSTSGLHGNAGQANYSTAKLGIVGFTKTIAKEWGAFNIRSNAVAFGFINTRLTQAKSAGASIEVEGQTVKLGVPVPMDSSVDKLASIPLRRPGNVDEAAGSILLLASPYASYINGHCL